MKKDRENLSTTFIMIVIFLVVFITLLSMVMIRLRQVVNVPEPVSPPLTKQCTTTELLNAYANGYPVAEGCPEWRNNLVVNETYNLLEKPLVDEDNCCFFSDDNKISVQFPSLCTNVPYFPYRPSLELLNKKPYFSEGYTYSFIYHVCENYETCMVLANGKNMEDGTSVYKISKYIGYSEVDNLSWYDLVMQPQCGKILKVYEKGKLILYWNGEDYVSTDGQYREIILELIQYGDYLSPIAGINTSASEQAQRSVYI
jgi:hypothetical protein